MSKKQINYFQDDPKLFFQPRTLKACFFAWLFPGAGHFFLGAKRRAYLLSGCLLFALFLGIVQGGDLYPLIGEGKIRTIGAICQFGMGIPHLLVRMVLDRGTPLNITYDYGTIYFLIAGMINWLSVIDAFDIAVGRK